MATTAGLIDLGELPHGEPVEEEAPWPVRERLRRLRPRHLRWAATAAGITALVLATTGAPATLPSPALTLAFTVPASSFAVDDDNLYVLSAPGTLTAYRLADGAVRWRHTSDLLTESSWIDNWQGPLFVASYSESGERTTRFDPETGHPLWTRAGMLSSVAGDRVLLQRQLGTEPTIDESVPPSEVTAVDLTTGDPVWSHTLSTWHYRSDPGRPGRLVALAPDGRLETYDLDTGELIASVPTSGSPDLTQPAVVGSLVLLQNLPEGPDAVAYDVETLARRWVLDDLSGWLSECGRLLCVSGTGMPRAIHPGTGQTAWSATWFPPTGPDNWLDIIDPDAGWLDGYLVFSQFGASGLDPRTWLVDEATGEPVLDLGRWSSPFPFDAAGGAPPIMFWHEEERAWVGRLRDDLSVHLLGTVEVSVSPDLYYPVCQGVAGYAVCVSQVGSNPDDAELRVWRIR